MAGQACCRCHKRLLNQLCISCCLARCNCGVRNAACCKDMCVGNRLQVELVQGDPEEEAEEGEEAAKGGLRL